MMQICQIMYQASISGAYITPVRNFYVCVSGVNVGNKWSRYFASTLIYSANQLIRVYLVRKKCRPISLSFE